MSGDVETPVNEPPVGPAAPPTTSAVPTSRAAPELRPVRPEDTSALYSLLTHLLSDMIPDESRWAARWRWQYWENPYREGRPAGWVLADGERILGHLGAVYVPLRIGSQQAIGAIGADYAVADEAIARGGTFVGLALAQTLFSTCKDCVVMATTANEKTGAVFGRFGCQSIEWTREFWRARASLGQQIRACRGGSNRVARRLFNSWLGPSLLRYAAGAYRVLRHRPTIPIPPGCWLETTVPQLARDLGRFCEEASNNPADTSEGTNKPGGLGSARETGHVPPANWGVHRSQAYLDWRYGRHPEREHVRILVVRDREGRPIGAAVVFVDRREDRPNLYVEELIAPRDRIDVVKTLLCAALRLAGEQGAHYLITMCGLRSIRPTFWELGFKDRARNAPAAVIQPSPVDAPDAFAHPPHPFTDHVEFWHGIMF